MLTRHKAVRQHYTCEVGHQAINNSRVKDQLSQLLVGKDGQTDLSHTSHRVCIPGNNLLGIVTASLYTAYDTSDELMTRFEENRAVDLLAHAVMG